MTELNKQALRGQSVEGSYYLAECGHCGEMYPSNKLDGGEQLFSGDYGECFCHLCGADDSDIADNGAWGSEAVIAWNYQQKRIEALLDELEAAEKCMAGLGNALCELLPGTQYMDPPDGGSVTPLEQVRRMVAEYRERIEELESRMVTVKLPADYRNSDSSINDDMFNTCAVVGAFRDALAAAGIGVKGE
ncbi:hypothetical protein [Citrobacter freundii]|uniref:hypothetical protein n=1 Tax=Citrobacter freundii TaxID=546 RepID=UPI0015FABFCF|nr:hypothetical protein [Citrobacter freundii]MBA8045644.1 hypothetical protein [Citrobacter freundii]